MNKKVVTAKQNLVNQKYMSGEDNFKNRSFLKEDMKKTSLWPTGARSQRIKHSVVDPK